MEFLSPDFDLTAENLGKRVQARLGEIPKPVRAEYPDTPPAVDVVKASQSVPVDLTGEKPVISRGALSELVLSMSESPESHDDKRFCEFAASLILKTKSPVVYRNELREILQVTGAFGLGNCLSYRALDTLSRRAPVGL